MFNQSWAAVLYSGLSFWATWLARLSLNGENAAPYVLVQVMIRHPFMNLPQFGSSNVRQRSYTLQYITLHHVSLHYSTLHYITLHYITLHYIASHYSSFHYITLHYIASHYSSLHYITLHCITVHYTTLHYITLHHITIHCIILHYSTIHYSTVQYGTVQYSTYIGYIRYITYITYAGYKHYMHTYVRTCVLPCITTPSTVHHPLWAARAGYLLETWPANLETSYTPRICVSCKTCTAAFPESPRWLV